jgi:hypothetical protein
MAGVLGAGVRPSDAATIQAMLAVHRENKGEIDTRARDLAALITAGTDTAAQDPHLAKTLQTVQDLCGHVNEVWQAKMQEYTDCEQLCRFQRDAAQVWPQYTRKWNYIKAKVWLYFALSCVAACGHGSAPYSAERS